MELDVYELIKDFDQITKKSILDVLPPVRKAVLLSANAIHRHPHIAMQTVFNYLAWEKPLSPELNANLERAKIELDKKPFWIRSLAPFPVRQSSNDWKIEYEITSPIQSLCSDCSHFAVSSGEGRADISTCDTGNALTTECWGNGRSRPSPWLKIPDVSPGLMWKIAFIQIKILRPTACMPAKPASYIILRRGSFMSICKGAWCVEFPGRPIQWCYGKIFLPRSSS